MAVLEEVSRHYGRVKLYINGQWIDPASGVYFETMNPASSLHNLRHVSIPHSFQQQVRGNNSIPHCAAVPTRERAVSIKASLS